MRSSRREGWRRRWRPRPGIRGISFPRCPCTRAVAKVEAEVADPGRPPVGWGISRRAVGERTRPGSLRGVGIPATWPHRGLQRASTRVATVQRVDGLPAPRAHIPWFTLGRGRRAGVALRLFPGRDLVVPRPGPARSRLAPRLPSPLPSQRPTRRRPGSPRPARTLRPRRPTSRPRPRPAAGHRPVGLGDRARLAALGIGVGTRRLRGLPRRRPGGPRRRDDDGRLVAPARQAPLLRGARRRPGRPGVGPQRDRLRADPRHRPHRPPRPA